MQMKLTRHNGRSGKNGAYNPKHNDRKFDLKNSEHIDAERAKRNIYWDCYQGFRTPFIKVQSILRMIIRTTISLQNHIFLHSGNPEKFSRQYSLQQCI